MAKPIPPLEIYFTRIDARTMPEPNSGCWLWEGAIDSDGYARIGMNRKWRKVSRVQYERHHGPIADGLLIRHTCDVRLCISPYHLIPGTPLDNMSDAVLRGRHAGGGIGERTRGERCCFAKLRDDDVREIKSLYATGGYNFKALGARYGVHPTQISRIILRGGWKHVQ